MKLIIGLGNPDKKYTNTPHNLGFVALDEIQKEYNEFFPNFKLNKKFQAEISKGKFPDKDIILAKPQTFMNLSGKSVQAIKKFYKIKPQDIWIFHDDIDLPLGKIRISKKSGAAGHKGVQSIIDMLGTKNFVRFRMGIKTPMAEKIPSEDFVLRKFSKSDQTKTDKMINQALEACNAAAELGITKAMNLYN
ncbi:aminoacyl-tRNA hydrolase [Candidatus Saccharibacteria bacterium]|nr:aminoacyl-tRNA hydrolase [Candidatus Saccharibacteria bacterium]NIV03163.1 aminoacyl-tRNA hydrolase [Calditrichia bacterium]NIS37680.1 aminoacyl-tRNA hydrolase [Candidatus Saccharibacteria bacterium]NIV71269.1 aminoacyl-tRNA hydrolase [Calditrichia bacterium]NIV97744.1 aminoacyl-tRNA hydrolase [Candidatus Saccharibacteria bacterium]